MIRLIITTIAVASVYSILLMAIVGLLIMALPFQANMGEFGPWLLFFIFLLLIYPAKIFSAKMIKENTSKL